MTTAISEYLNQQIGASIDNLGVVFKITRGIDHAEDFGDAFYLREVSYTVAR
jgi:hypothetical protein